MKPINYLRKHYSYLLVFAFTVLYMLFHSVNSVGDAYSNAFLSLSGENMSEPHHLLYCLYGNIVLKLFSWLKVEPLVILQWANALVAGGTLLVVRRIVKRIHHGEAFISCCILVCGAGFGFTRFATDNECYIVPLFFEMLTLYYVQAFLIRNSASRVAKAAVAAVAACLFHQTGIFVWLCALVLFAVCREKKYPIIYIGVSLLIPLAYLAASFSISGSLSFADTVRFALRDYLDGTAAMPSARNVLLLTGVNLFRTFFQMHGYVFEMFKAHPAGCIFVAAICIGGIILAIRAFVKEKKRDLHLFQERRFVRVVWAVLILTLAFAAFSDGNAEFMLPIPFLLVVLYAYHFSDHRVLFPLGLSLLLWNGVFGLYPQSRMELSPEGRIATLARQYPDAVFVLKDKPLVENICLYRYGSRKLPTMRHARLYSKSDWRKDKAEGKTIITDAIGAREALSRAELTQRAGFDFSGVETRKLLFSFSSPKCKRSVYRL